MATGLRLNFACGPSRWAGFVNSDIHGEEGSETISLDERPYPFPDDSAELIMISHGLCIRPNKRAILAEFARILRPGGWLRIDDNPYRFHNGVLEWERINSQWGRFPDDLLCPRGVLVEWLLDLGFSVIEQDPRETEITDDPELELVILGNQLGHESFTIEAQKQ